VDVAVEIGVGGATERRRRVPLVAVVVGHRSGLLPEPQEVG
jgi:hypothetical protein